MGLEAAGFRTISACELVKERADLLRRNFPEARVFQGDIWELRDAVVAHAEAELRGERLDAILLTPPCQGASSNGKGRIARQVMQHFGYEVVVAVHVLQLRQVLCAFDGLQPYGHVREIAAA